MQMKTIHSIAERRKKEQNMKIIKGLKLGGLQQKIFNLVLVFILILIGVYTAVSVWHQRNLTQIVQEAAVQQQDSITEVSELRDTSQTICSAMYVPMC